MRFAAALVAYGDLLATNTGEHARAQEMYQVCPYIYPTKTLVNLN